MTLRKLRAFRFTMRNWRFYLSSWIVKQGQRVCQHTVFSQVLRCANCGKRE